MGEFAVGFDRRHAGATLKKLPPAPCGPAASFLQPFRPSSKH
jgi:hypothetical protein